MRLLAVVRDCAQLELTASELLILNNTLNEVCNGIDVPEFHTRIGAEKTDVALLQKNVADIFRLLGQ
jgi:hypothetical protein